MTKNDKLIIYRVMYLKYLKHLLFQIVFEIKCLDVKINNFLKKSNFTIFIVMKNLSTLNNIPFRNMKLKLYIFIKKSKN